MADLKLWAILISATFILNGQLRAQVIEPNFSTSNPSSITSENSITEKAKHKAEDTNVTSTSNRKTTNRPRLSAPNWDILLPLPPGYVPVPDASTSASSVSITNSQSYDERRYFHNHDHHNEDMANFPAKNSDTKVFDLTDEYDIMTPKKHTEFLPEENNEEYDINYDDNYLHPYSEDEHHGEHSELDSKYEADFDDVTAKAEVLFPRKDMTDSHISMEDSSNRGQSSLSSGQPLMIDFILVASSVFLFLNR